MLPEDIAGAWRAVLEQVRLKSNHQIQRQELSVREYMTSILRKLQQNAFVEFKNLFEPQAGIGVAIVNYLAILELAKEGLIRITQAAPFAPLFVHGQAPAQQQQLELTHA